jgi:uncharacterized protein YciI
MLFFIRCRDKAGAAGVRAANRAAHLDHLERHAGQIVAAGPTLTDDREGMTGSVLFMDFPDRAAAEAFVAADPYATAGLFDSVEILAWKQVYPKS